ncbi:MAG: hypothetical protein OEY59_09395 [Deltaproteobacteria bacterium]|nr:hypothetical protein [Deltaproteobacteria bacterium]
MRKRHEKDEDEEELEDGTDPSKQQRLFWFEVLKNVVIWLAAAGAAYWYYFL